MVERELRERIFIRRRRAGRRFFARLDAELAEQDFLNLLGRIEIERLAGELMRGRFELHHPGAKFTALDFEQRRVEQNTVAFHRM